MKRAKVFEGTVSMELVYKRYFDRQLGPKAFLRSFFLLQ